MHWFNKPLTAGLLLASVSIAGAQSLGPPGGGGGGGGGAPSGPAGGVLSGTYPDPGLNAACSDLSNDGPYCPATLGQLPGINTNAAALAGNVGEVIQSITGTGAGVAMTSTNPNDVTSISLTPGQWLVFGNVSFGPNTGTTISVLACWISTTTAAFPTNPGDGGEMILQLSFTTATTQILPCGARVLNLNATTTVYLSAVATFGVSTLATNGAIIATRLR